MRTEAETLIEHTVVEFEVTESVEVDDARRLRGAVAAVMQRPEFHNHVGEKLSYSEPLIRYDANGGKLRAIGIGNGAILLKALSRFEELRLGNRELKVHQQTTSATRQAVGPVSDMLRYRFLTVCLPLNQRNHTTWQRAHARGRHELMVRILIGNLLSFAKGIGMSVSSRLELTCQLEPVGFRTLKPGVRLLAFTGEFSTNFLLPTLWGLGKSTSRGFGTVEQIKEAP